MQTHAKDAKRARENAQTTAHKSRKSAIASHLNKRKLKRHGVLSLNQVLPKPGPPSTPYSQAEDIHDRKQMLCGYLRIGRFAAQSSYLLPHPQTRPRRLETLNPNMLPPTTLLLHPLVPSSRSLELNLLQLFLHFVNLAILSLRRRLRLS